MHVTPLLFETAKLRAAAREARHMARHAGDAVQIESLLRYASHVEHRADGLYSVAMKILGTR